MKERKVLKQPSNVNKKAKILVTGSAGFIGFYVARKLLELGYKVIGLDNFNDYYDPRLKKDRNQILEKYKNFKLYRGDLVNKDFIFRIFKKYRFNKVCHLAAQAGVRYSLENSDAYVQSNLVGFINILEAMRKFRVPILVYASSSSVYGANKKVPFSEVDNVDRAISLYGATKKSNEVIAHAYHHLFGIKCTGLRFFTVYGPWGRPDMAYFKFTKAILDASEIKVYNYNKMERDFTYIDDIVNGVISALNKSYDFEIFNLGNNQPVRLKYFIELIGKELNKKVKKKFLPLQPGEMVKTCADIDKAKRMLGYKPQTKIEQGIRKFINWYKDYYKIK